MDLKEIITGIFWLVAGNLVFYLIYPLYTSILDGLGTSVMGDFALTDTLLAIGWGGYFLIWGIMGVIIPLYLVIKGSNKD